jgi:hypothetical protein
VLAGETTRWRRAAVPGWRGEGDRIAGICPGTAVRRHAGLPVVPARRRVPPRAPCRRFGPQALPRADPAREPPRVVRWPVRRRRLGVTVREVRGHRGAEARRRWSDKAIARAAPCPPGPFPGVAPPASRLDGHARGQASASARRHRRRPAFAGGLAAARRAIWSEQGFTVSRQSVELTERPRALREGIAHALRHAA